jgi:hypothetical protein
LQLAVTEAPATAGQKTRQDLEARTAKFGIDVIKFAHEVRENPVTKPLVSQLVRAATSVGANYCEAKHWLQLMVAAAPEHRTAAAGLWREAKELTLVFGAIARSCDKPR